ncbi:uncharacterized protein JCM15063_002573 [Sporobolomyces koalae]|uniref:uncharacterized protein n=1 Tax=Sporobolomyces koalae TaxID=500713 RepID=UPI003181C993
MAKASESDPDLRLAFLCSPLSLINPIESTLEIMFALRQTLTTSVRASSLRSFSSSVRVCSEGAPSGHGQDGFNKREKAEEEKYVRDAEREKLKALQKSIEASKAHLAELESQHKTLSSSLPKDESK